MKIKKSNRGAISHIGVVLSFVIFVTFIMFIYIIVKPVITTEDKQALLSYVEGVIVENSSVNLLEISVLMADFSENCGRLVNFLEGMNMDRIIVKNTVGEVLNSQISGQDLYVENGNEKFLKIFSSDEFDITETGTMSGCKNLVEGSTGYVFGFIRTEKNVFENRILQIIESYDNNYKGLKEELSITTGEHFQLSFTYANGTTIATEEKENSENVFINEFPIQYISKTASKEVGYLNVGTW